MKHIFIIVIASLIIGFGLGWWTFSKEEEVITPEKNTFTEVDSLLKVTKVNQMRLDSIIQVKDSLASEIDEGFGSTQTPPIQIIEDEDSLLNSLNKTINGY